MREEKKTWNEEDDKEITLLLNIQRLKNESKKIGDDIKQRHIRNGLQNNGWHRRARVFEARAPFDRKEMELMDEMSMLKQGGLARERKLIQANAKVFRIKREDKSAVEVEAKLKNVFENEKKGTKNER